MSNSDTPLLCGIGLDSIETLALVVGIEEEFEIRVPDSDFTVALVKNIGTLAEYVWQKIAEKQQKPEPHKETTRNFLS